MQYELVTHFYPSHYYSKMKFKIIFVLILIVNLPIAARSEDIYDNLINPCDTSITEPTVPNNISESDNILDDSNNALNSDVVQMDDINIEATISLSERLRQRREKLEERNKTIVEKKIEDIRVKQEIQLTKKLEDAFGKSLNNLKEDKALITQTEPMAPQPINSAQAPLIETKIIDVESDSRISILNTTSSSPVSLGGTQAINLINSKRDTNILNFIQSDKIKKKACEAYRRKMLTINQESLKQQAMFN